jgi:hypothetical protein
MRKRLFTGKSQYLEKAIDEERAKLKLKLSESGIVAHLRRGRVLLVVGLSTRRALQNQKLKWISFDRIELS